MNWLDDRIPLYVSSWMDSGNIYHFASHGRALLLITFVSFVVISALVRQAGMVIWFVLLTLATFNGFPIELTWVALTVTSVVWTVAMASKKDRRALFPALGLLWLGFASWRGVYQTEGVSMSRCRNNLNTIMVAVEMYAQENDALPPDLSHLVDPRFPEDWRCRASVPGPQYRLEVQGNSYTVSCVSGWHPSQEAPLTRSGSISPNKSPDHPAPSH